MGLDRACIDLACAQGDGQGLGEQRVVVDDRHA
jgi:hypothetical protein